MKATGSCNCSKIISTVSISTATCAKHTLEIDGLPMAELLRAAERHALAGRQAVRSDGRITSYGQLLERSEAILHRMSKGLPLRREGSLNLNGPRIGVFAAPGPQYVASTWATWLAGGVVVPLAISHPTAELQYVLQDAGVSAVLAPEAFAHRVKEAASIQGCQLHLLEDALFPATAAVDSEAVSGANGADTMVTNELNGHSDSVTDGQGALIIYTSGTTGRPKGALHTHGSLRAQVECLVQSWRWTASDSILHSLPLHHIHGIVNALYCAHYVGGRVDFMQKFSPSRMWSRLGEGDTTVLMAVPTMYNYLLSNLDKMAPDARSAATAAASSLRLTVSGSAACPLSTMERWQAMSGQVLLERYGMTETGMILSNPYEGERRQGFVGLALPGVQLRISLEPDASQNLPMAPLNTDSCDPSSAAASAATSTSTGPAAAAFSPVASSTSANGTAVANGSQGELRVKGPMLFKEYWGRPEATAEAFDADGFYRTGDIVSYEGTPPYFRIMGRASVDIIKSGGFKISALDIEDTLNKHPAVAEVAVVGLADEDRGEVVAALVVSQQQQGTNDSSISLQSELADWCRAELAPYQVPRVWRFVGALPRNAMGKVNKKQLKAEMFA